MLVVPARLHRWPPEVQDLFGREGPLVLEIGFGDGRFTAELARSRPDWLVLGAEVSAASVLRALRRMRREGLANVRLYHGQGPFALRNLVLPGTLDQVIVNFPDPWPKKRHQERRLLREAFFRRLSTRLKSGGSLLLTTDHEGYFRFALEEAERTFFHAAFIKLREDPAPWPPLRRYDVAHALLSGELPQDLALEKTAVRLKEGVAVFLEVARGKEGFYVLTHVEEEDATHDLLLQVRKSARGVYAGVSRFGSPLITEAVKGAVRALVDRLEAHGLEVVQDHT